ncbi:DUF488 family protein [Thermosulfurimonas dismutans]|uniref:DUF488 domain-containing protein n=1 Tax=Thermosulfurimonas dismutans TaxID=999894 RepID=UPI0008384C42|nr:DUF488 domain-containing protein [Thermosulfurimonas dismutans]
MIKPQIYTLGHSNHPREVFEHLLKAHHIELLVDVRRFASSKKFPHFAGKALATFLEDRCGVGYLALPDLGGYRKPKPDSVNTGIENPGFRGYADHMQTEAFQAAFKRLLEEARRWTTAIMCAEGFPWRCHRWFLADLLLINGFEVKHILPDGKIYLHRLNPRARKVGDFLVYR